METKHTKGKWIIKHRPTPSTISIWASGNSNNYGVAIAGGSNSIEAEANAERIVECVNNYDALKEENERLKNIAYDLTGKVADLKDIREQENFKNERLKEALKFALNTGHFINDHYDHIKSVLKLCTDKEGGNNE